MLKYILILIIALITLFIALVIWQMNAYKTPEPTYTVLQKDNNIEIRQYPPIIVAEVKVSGERYAAINQGFRMLADYIFGNNKGSDKIAMTAPVIQQPAAIPMTAPVTQEKDGNLWRIRFVMPETYTLDTLPKPNNKDVSLIKIPGKTYAVIQFTGFNSSSNLNQHEAELKAFAKAHQLKQMGEPIYAFYNPPWILPFLRRNEIMIEIDWQP